jgi:signal transduction histidine kinase/tetratricopeptide (TPR) repeat protein
MRILVLIAFSYVTAIYTYAQTLDDSLKKELSMTKNDTLKARLYKKITESFTTSDPDKALMYANEGMAHVTRMKWQKGIAAFHTSIGNIRSNTGKYDEALLHYTQALKLDEALKNPVNIATSLNNLGTLYQRQGNYSVATDYFFKALKVAQEADNKSLIALAYENIAVVYNIQSDFEKAIEFSGKALEVAIAEKDSAMMATKYKGLGDIYVEQGKYPAKAADSYAKALALFEKFDNKIGIAGVYSNLSVLHKNNLKLRIDYALKAQTIWEEVSPSHHDAIYNLGNLGVAYLDLAKYDTLPQKNATVFGGNKQEWIQKSEKYLERTIRLCQETGNKDTYSYYTGVLSELEEFKGDYKKALDYFRTYVSIRDSLFSQENKNKIASIESQQQIELKNKELVISKLEVESQKKWLWGLVIGAFMLGIIGVLLYRQNLSRKKANTQLTELNIQLQEANQIKARFLAILSHDIRRPIASFINFLHLQQEAPELLDTQKIDAFYTRTGEFAEGLLKAMENMLFWSKSQMENAKPEIKTVTTKEVFDSLRLFFQGTDDVNLVFEETQDIILQTDENYLQTIMQNLTVNAIQALRDTPQATIQWKAYTDNNSVVLAITDNGPGITPKQSEAIFNEVPLYVSKSGMGLHIIRDLAKAINCRLQLDSQTGIGTTFKLVL